ncbi:MAG: DUF2975 domain-containing protein [Clostridiales bacterium]|jgi:hypothetical protein|nr:DUF2975 domain-containing protein [Clostridiales bacterium]MDD2572531.1 DUF2975 domain-containing protein [Eubacteriales bacterium]MDY0119776.1 DUF2975 domain-containing protein [Clostridia bacterium]NLG30705.1 DUF2975 domain-containing protein [Clostridiaceae bacterium]MCK9349953.1 DUF2975 domain-containing protein [Clostridiales bacterium]
MNRARNILLLILLGISIVFLIYAAVTLYHVSESFVLWNPELAPMQVPLLILSYGVILMLLGMFAIAMYLVLVSNKQNIFQTNTVRWLNRMGHLSLIAFSFMLIMFVYGYVKLGTELGLPGGYMIVAGGFLFLASNVFYFMGTLFRQAVAFKEENELTV